VPDRKSEFPTVPLFFAGVPSLACRLRQTFRTGCYSIRNVPSVSKRCRLDLPGFKNLEGLHSASLKVGRLQLGIRPDHNVCRHWSIKRADRL